MQEESRSQTFVRLEGYDEGGPQRPPLLSLGRAKHKERTNMYAPFIVEWWRRAGRREDGQDLLEYALLVALIVLVAVGAVTTVGITLKAVVWNVIAASL